MDKYYFLNLYPLKILFHPKKELVGLIDLIFNFVNLYLILKFKFNPLQVSHFYFYWECYYLVHCVS